MKEYALRCFRRWALKEMNDNFNKGQVYGENCVDCLTKYFPKELKEGCCMKCKNHTKK